MAKSVFTKAFQVRKYFHDKKKHIGVDGIAEIEKCFADKLEDLSKQAKNIRITVTNVRDVFFPWRQ